jgi:hypothetical protein
VLFDVPVQQKDLSRIITRRARQRDWIEPKLGAFRARLHMDVRRLRSLIRIEKEAVAANAQNGWHVVAPYSAAASASDYRNMRLVR